MSIADLDTLKDIHRRVKARFEYTSDWGNYQKLEYWPEAAEIMGEGTLREDCDGFALACRAECREAGIDDSRLVLCQTETGEGHLVLEVGGYILDNRQWGVVSRDTLDYRWISISGFQPGDPWHRIVND